MIRETTYKGSTGNAFTLRGTINWSDVRKSAAGSGGGTKGADAGGRDSLTAMMGKKESITQFRVAK